MREKVCSGGPVFLMGSADASWMPPSAPEELFGELRGGACTWFVHPFEPCLDERRYYAWKAIKGWLGLKQENAVKR